MKETHEQRKTKIDIDEFRSGTTNITLTNLAQISCRAGGAYAPTFTVVLLIFYLIWPPPPS